MILYFAYGSNLWQPRISCRVGAVRAVGVAQLDGHALAWHKRSKDGSGKCDIVEDASSVVLGVIYELSDQKMTLLDEAEGVDNGYRRITVAVRVHGASMSATTYRADRGHVDPGAVPYDWYKEVVVAGARAHGLPEDYVARITATVSIADPKPLRAAKERAQLELVP